MLSIVMMLKCMHVQQLKGYPCNSIDLLVGSTVLYLIVLNFHRKKERKKKRSTRMYIP